HRLDKASRLWHRVMSPGIQPGDAPPEFLQVQLVLFEIQAVQISDLELTASRRLERSSELAGIRVVEVKPRHGVVTLRLSRLLFNADDSPSRIELHHTVCRRILGEVAKDGCPRLTRVSTTQEPREPVAEEDVVAEHERRWST